MTEPLRLVRQEPGFSKLGRRCRCPCACRYLLEDAAPTSRCPRCRDHPEVPFTKKQEKVKRNG